MKQDVINRVASLVLKDKEDAVLANLSKARNALTKATTAQESQTIAHIALAWSIFCRRAKLSQECRQSANALWIDASCKLGKQLKDMPKATGTRGAGNPNWLGDTVVVSPSDQPPSYASQGIDAKEAALAQKIAELPEDDLENIKEGAKSLNAALKAAEDKKRKEKFYEPIDVRPPKGLHHGDFRELSSCIQDNSVELIFIDPPYDKDSVQLYGDAARVAARILKPGGSFVAYSGQKHLQEVLAACKEHLIYWWIFAVNHSGQQQMLQKLGVRCGWKPLIWFVKQTRGDVAHVIRDVIDCGVQEKSAHEWQQSEFEADRIIRELTSEGGVVVDFFLGSGTTAVAAQRAGRRWIGFEIDASAINSAIERLKDE